MIAQLSYSLASASERAAVAMDLCLTLLRVCAKLLLLLLLLLLRLLQDQLPALVPIAVIAVGEIWVKSKNPGVYQKKNQHNPPFTSIKKIYCYIYNNYF